MMQLIQALQYYEVDGTQLKRAIRLRISAGMAILEVKYSAKGFLQRKICINFL